MWTEDKWRWAEALQIEKWKGQDARAYVDERIATLGGDGDAAGAERFRAVKIRLVQLTGGAPQ